jgi:hypothetical protein
MNFKHPNFLEALELAKQCRTLYGKTSRSPQQLHRELNAYMLKNGKPLSASIIGDIVNYAYYPHDDISTLRNIMDNGF